MSSGPAGRHFTVTYAKEPAGTWWAEVQGYAVRLEGVAGEDLNERIFQAVRVLAGPGGPLSVSFVPESSWAQGLRANAAGEG